MASETNAEVRCDTCKRPERISMSHCLRSGFPRCCGYTMSLVKIDGQDPLRTVAEATTEAIKQQLAPLKGEG